MTAFRLRFIARRDSATIPPQKPPAIKGYKMLKKDKVKVIDEDMNDEKIARFLTLQPYGDESADFHVLTKAYRGLPVEYFTTFLAMFLAEGRDINAKNSQGQSFLGFIEGNSNFTEFAELLKNNGAQ